MALFKARCASVEIEIHEVDHGPPHCHVSDLAGGRSVKVNLLTLEVTRPRGFRLPPAVRRCLRSRQVEMLEAWERVKDSQETGEEHGRDSIDPL